MLLAIVGAALMVSPAVSGQDATPEGPAITIENAVVSEITNEGIIVNGLLVVLDDDDDITVTVGSSVNVIGVLQTDGTVVVININVDDNDDNDDGLIMILILMLFRCSKHNPQTTPAMLFMYIMF